MIHFNIKSISIPFFEIKDNLVILKIIIAGINMPTVLIIGNTRFYFNSREETRRHIHIETPDGIAKFWLESKNGTNTLEYEVTNIERYGIWLLADDKEYYIKFDDYLLLKKSTVEQILNVQKTGPGHYRWPDIDEDIELEALDNPDKFMLGYK